MKSLVEFVWIDGTDPVKKLRSKAKVVDVGHPEMEDLLLQEEWNFDGSSTNQADGHDSERVLRPARVYNDPNRPEGHKMVLCEVFLPDGKTPHESNTRAPLRNVLDSGGKELDTWWGFEQEYCLMKGSNILGWPDHGFPSPQGPYYCGVGADEVVGRKVVERHAEDCLRAGIMLHGINAEVMLGQWEFQVGYRGFDDDQAAGPLKISDDLWMARYLLYRAGEEYDVWATLDPKPKKGDWNGSGLHTNFSDKLMRSPETGLDRIDEVMKYFKANHTAHQELYGYNNHERLTGKHETSAYDHFNYGVANRGTSVRMPCKTRDKGCGYLEDRRPAANADPYEVSTRILKTMRGDNAA